MTVEPAGARTVMLLKVRDRPQDPIHQVPQVVQGLLAEVVEDHQEAVEVEGKLLLLKFNKFMNF